MHTNIAIVPFRSGTPDKRSETTPSADFDFTNELHAAALFGAFSLESLTNGARGVELKAYSPRRCADVVLSPAPDSLRVRALMHALDVAATGEGV